MGDKIIWFWQAQKYVDMSYIYYHFNVFKQSVLSCNNSFNRKFCLKKKLRCLHSAVLWYLKADLWEVGLKIFFECKIILHFHLITAMSWLTLDHRVMTNGNLAEGTENCMKLGRTSHEQENTIIFECFLR